MRPLLWGDIMSMHAYVVRCEDYPDLQADLRIHYEFVPGEDCLSPDGADVDFDRVQALHADATFGTATPEQVVWARAWVETNKEILINQALADLEVDANLRDELLEEQHA
jgi:hypothetical protein